MKALYLLCFLLGCNEPLRDNPVDASSVGDGPHSDASGPGLVTTTCKLNKRISTQATGSRSEVWTYFVPVENATPGDGLSVVVCDFISASGGGATCAAGATCTVTGDPLPTGRACIEATLTFYGSTAIADCGYGFHDFNAAGTQTSASGYHYMSAEIRR